MKSEKEIVELIDKVEKAYNHVLTGDFATIQVNPARVLMQVEAKAILKTLYCVIGKECPIYEYEKDAVVEYEKTKGGL